MNKKTSIIIFEYKKSKVKPSQIFKSLRNWQRESKHKFKYHTIIDANPRNKASIIAVGIKPILPDPPRPPMMPSKYGSNW